MTEPTPAIVHIVIRGRVQGVGYRAFVEDEAWRRNIAGWVRNRGDGTVEALFAGEAETVDAMIAACRRGPLGARVDALYQSTGEAADLAMRQPGEAFSVLATV
jgi:acylphosphatase